MNDQNTNRKNPAPAQESSDARGAVALGPAVLVIDPNAATDTVRRTRALLANMNKARVVSQQNKIRQPVE